MGGWWIDRVADMNMLKVYAPPSPAALSYLAGAPRYRRALRGVV